MFYPEELEEEFMNTSYFPYYISKSEILNPEYEYTIRNSNRLNLITPLPGPGRNTKSGNEFLKHDTFNAHSKKVLNLQIHIQSVDKKPTPVPTSVVPKIVLVAGNVGRNFVKKLIKIENAYPDVRYEITSELKPGASRREIIKTAVKISETLSFNDTIILWPNDPNLSTKMEYQEFLPFFKNKRLVVFSEPYSKNVKDNDHIHRYNRALEMEIDQLKYLYPNLKLFDCNYFLRRSNYLGFKHELRGYAKYLLAKYVLYFITFTFSHPCCLNKSDNKRNNSRGREEVVPTITALTCEKSRSDNRSYIMKNEIDDLTSDFSKLGVSKSGKFWDAGKSTKVNEFAQERLKSFGDFNEDFIKIDERSNKNKPTMTGLSKAKKRRLRRKRKAAQFLMSRY